MIDIIDIISGLQVMAKMAPAVFDLGADVNGNGQIDLADVIYDAQYLAGMK